MKLKIFIIIFSLLIGNDKWNFSADGELREYQKNNITITKLTDNVEVFNDSLYLKTNQAYNYKELNELHLYGNTMMISDNDTLICDSMIYWLELDSLIASGNIILKRVNQKLTSKTLNFWKTNGFRGSSFIAEDSVVVIDETKTIMANTIKYDDENQEMLLLDDANLLSNNRQIFGDNINIRFDDSLMKFITVKGNATAHNITYAKSNKESVDKKKFIDVMIGNTINVLFDNNKIQTIKLDKMASTKYHAIDSTILIGVNSVNGNLINLDFDNDELYKINVQGDARGVFIPEIGNSKIDSTITYKSDLIDYLVETKESYLNDVGKIEYQNMLLESNYIHVDWENNILHAIKKNNKLPAVITSDGEPMEGDSLKYNLLDKHGTIYKGKTKVDDAYYHGDQIYRDDPNLYHVISSEYTSCDLDHPHYSFYSNNMKMIPGDRIIAKPLILKILDFPIMGIPFAVLPNKGGSRHSGWIMPSFGFDNINGSTMNDLGYYWAPNDYIDSRLLINFADRIGIWLRNTFRYKVRYVIDGSLDLKLVRKLNNTEHIESIFTDSTNQQYEIKFNHSHKISQQQKVNIRYNYVSNYDFHKNTNSDPLASINQQLSKSSLSYSNAWPSWGNAITLNISDITDLKKQETISLTPADSNITVFPIVRNSFPSITFNHSTSSLFGDGERWYQKLKWSFSSNHSGYYKKGVYSDNNFNWKDTTDYKNGISNKLLLSYSNKIFTWLNIANRISVTEDWIFKYKEYSQSFDQYTIKDGFKRRLKPSVSTTFNTKLYGVFPFNIGSIEALRHTITPSVSISYTPDITKPIMGYDLNTLFTNIGQFEFDANNRLLDPFHSSAVAPTSTKEQLMYTFKVQNLFQTKQMQDSTVQKNNVLNWTSNTSYNASKDSLNWNPIISRLDFEIPNTNNKINIDLTHDIYELVNGRRINKYNNQFYNIPLPSLTKAVFRTSVSLKGKRLVEFIPDSVDNRIATSSKNLWSTNLGISYRKEQKFNYSENTMVWDESFQLNTNTTLQLSEKWKLSYRVSFDLIEKVMGWQSFSFHRDLHCWKFNFNWIPGRSYFLHIYVKKPELRDIKLESRSKKNKTNSFFN